MSDVSQVDWNPRCQCTIWPHIHSTVDRLPVWHVHYFLTHPDPQVQAAAISRLIHLQRMDEDLDIHWVRDSLPETYEVLQNLGASEQLQVRQLAEQLLAPPTESDLSVLRLDEAALANARERVGSNRLQRFTKRETARQAIWDWAWQRPLPASATSDVRVLSGRHRRWLCETSAARDLAPLEWRHIESFVMDADCNTRHAAARYFLRRQDCLEPELVDRDTGRDLVVRASSDEPCPSVAEQLRYLLVAVGTPEEQVHAMSEIVRDEPDRENASLTWVLSHCDVTSRARRLLYTASNPSVRRSALIRPSHGDSLPRLPGYDRTTLATTRNPNDLYQEFLEQWRRIFKPAKKRRPIDKLWGNWKSRMTPLSLSAREELDGRFDRLHAIADRGLAPEVRFALLQQQLSDTHYASAYILKSIGWCLLAEAHQSQWYPSVRGAWMSVFQQFPTPTDFHSGGWGLVDGPGWPAALCEVAPESLGPEQWLDFWRHTDTHLAQTATRGADNSYGSHLPRVADIAWDPLWRMQQTELGNRAVDLLADPRESMSAETRARLGRVALRATGRPLALLE